MSSACVLSCWRTGDLHCLPTGIYAVGSSTNADMGSSGSSATHIVLHADGGALVSFEGASMLADINGHALIRT
jgi:hypothetical protein